MSRKKYVAAVGIAVPLMLGVAGPLASAQPVEMQPQVSTVQSQAGAQSRLTTDTDQLPAWEVLQQLEVGPRDADDGYDRALFYDDWTDVDGNDCDTRNDVLTRDLSNVETDPDCSVQHGEFVEPYTGQPYKFVAGETSSDIHIDHVVALHDAWQSGAQEWDEPTRSEFGQDPLNLLAVDGDQNSEKGSKTADAWLPDNAGYHCEYVARQVAVKYDYDLRVTELEKGAMEDVLQTCPDQMTPTRMMGQVGVGSAQTPAAQAPESAPSTTTATIAPEPEAPSTPEQPAPEQLPAEPAQPKQFEAQPEELAVTGTSATGMIAVAVSLVMTALAGVGLARRHDKKAV